MLYDDANLQVNAQKLVNPEPEETPDVSFVKKLGAAFRIDNTVGAWLSNDVELHDYNPNFNPWNSLTESERVDSRFVDLALDANSDRQLDEIRKQRADEQADRKKLTGIDGFAAQLVAGVVDPINLIPVGGTGYKTYRTGGSILKNAAITGAVASGAVAAQEAILHGQQVERTYGESAVNMTAGAFLGAVLGGGVGLLGKVQYDKALKQIEADLELDAPGAVLDDDLRYVPVGSDELDADIVDAYLNPNIEPIEIPDVELPQSKKSSKSPLDPDADELLVAVAKLGGINKQELLENGIDPASLARNIGFGLRVASPKGRNLDDIAESLVENGYLEARDSGELLEKLDESFRGNEQFSNTSEVLVRQTEQSEIEYDRYLLSMRDSDEYKALDDDLERAAFESIYDEELRLAVPEFEPLPKVIEGWHGSPHVFNEFDLSKVGTGEGAQAYGRGAYIAQERDVAEGYYKALRHKGVNFKQEVINAAQAEGLDLAENEAAIKELLRQGKAMFENGGKGKTYATKAQNASIDLRAMDPSAVARTIERYRNTLKESGALYRVEIQADDGEFLDWDKGIQEQPEAVRQLLREAGQFEDADKFLEAVKDKSPEAAKLAEDMIYGPEGARVDTDQADKNWEELYRLVPDGIDFDDIHDLSFQINDQVRSGGDLLGFVERQLAAADMEKVREINEQLTAQNKIMEEYAIPGSYRKYSDEKGEQAAKEYDRLLGERQTYSKNNTQEGYYPAEAAKQLSERGIKGVRYLDGFSRARPFKDIKREFLDNMPEDADFDELLEARGNFNPEQVAVIDALKEDGWLGFDYPAQAISAALGGKLDNWDPSPALVKAVDNLVNETETTSNYVVFDGGLITVLDRNGVKLNDSIKETAEYKSLNGAAEREAFESIYDEELKAGVLQQQADNRELMNDEEIQQILQDTANAGEGGGTPPDGPEFGADSVGAASARQEIRIKGSLAEKLVKAAGFDPLSRLLLDRSQASRRLITELVENPIDVEGYTGQAVESLVKLRRDSMTYRGVKLNREHYKAYLKDVGVGRVKAKFTGEAMSLREFNEAVGKQVRNPPMIDSTKNAHIKAAADDWVREIYEPQLKDMQEQRLIADDVKVETSKRYLNRVWQKDAIASDWPLFTARVSGWLQKMKVEEDVAAEMAEEIGFRIMSSYDSMLPYDFQLGDAAPPKLQKMFEDPQMATKTAPFKNRTFNIPDELVDDFLKNDIEEVATRYIRQTSADIEIMKRFGDPADSTDSTLRMDPQMKEIEADYKIFMDQAKTQKERRRLQRDFENRKKDVIGIVDRIRGQYHPDPRWEGANRFMQAARNLNFLRLMGGVTVSSIPDYSRVVMSEGLYRTFKGSFDNLARGLRESLGGSKNIAAEDIRYYGIGTDAYTGGRLEVISDINDYAIGQTKFERGLQSLANSFGNINLMNQWTGGMKAIHAISMQSRVMDQGLAGNYPEQLVRLGVEKHDLDRIVAQVKKHGKQDGGAWIFNAKNWDDRDLAMLWGAALKKESDRVIVIPGQEKPLFMSTEMGKTVLQFRSFMMSATQRVTIAAVQKQDAHLIEGALMMVSLGALTYLLKNAEAGREIDLAPETLIVEGIDRSGALGLFMEVNNTLEKFSGGNFGLRPGVGIDLPASRYASRSATEAILGPTWGSMLSTAGRVVTAATDEGEWSESDTRAVRRLLPYQNLTGFRRGLDKVESAIHD